MVALFSVFLDHPAFQGRFFTTCVTCLFSGQMRSLRLFYSDCACSAGQVVIASRESQYKILHFHNGGLDRLAEIFQEWSLFARETDKNATKNFKIKVRIALCSL